jgi:DNA-binding MarR family transcriptional regulator
VTSSDRPVDPAEAIAAALAKLRGRRGPRPPWEGGPHELHGHGPDAAGHGRGAHGGPWGRGGGRGMGGGRAWPPADGQPWPQGVPPWVAGSHGRVAGPARLRLLEALAAASESLSVSELAERIGVDQPRASRVVQQAVDMGLVRREADPDDARRTRVVLTEQGSAILRGFRGDRRDAVQSALDTFTDEERAELARLLTKLADSWPR